MAWQFGFCSLLWLDKSVSAVCYGLTGKSVSAVCYGLAVWFLQFVMA